MVDYKKLKLLREQTGISFSLCKKALEETKNNIEESKKLLNAWGVKKASEKSERTTSQGGIFSYVHHNNKVTSMVELFCETDFVSNNTEFKNLGTELSMQAASIPTKNAMDFLEQEYIRDPSKTIDSLIKEAVLKFGENIKVGRIMRWELGKSESV